MALQVGELYALLRLDDKGFDRGMINAHRRMGDAESKSSSMAKKLGHSFKSATGEIIAMGAQIGILTAGMGAIGAVGASVTKAMDFESQLSSIKAVSGATETEMETMKKLALDMGAKTKYSALESAQGIEELIKAGVSLKDIVNGGLDGALSLATAGELELADAAEIASTALNAFKKDGLSVTNAADLLAGAANASATSVGELKYGLSMSAAVAAGAGMKFKDVATALAVMANNGLKGSDAGTSLKTMLMSLQPETKKEIAQFKQLGIITKDGGNQFYTAEGKIKSFAEISQILHERLGGLTEAQRQLALKTMFGTDAVRAANIAFNEGAAGVNKMYAEMSKVTAAQVAKEKMNNLKGAIEELKGGIETLGITVGTKALPGLTKFTQRLTEMVNIIQRGFDAEGFKGALASLFPQELQDNIKGLLSLFEKVEEVKPPVGNADRAMEINNSPQGNPDRLIEAGTIKLKPTIDLGDFGNQLGTMIAKGIAEAFDKAVESLGSTWAERGKNMAGGALSFILGFVGGLLDPSVWWQVFKENWDVILTIIFSIIAAPEVLLGRLALVLSKIPFVGKIIAWLIQGISKIGKKGLAPIGNWFKDMAGFFWGAFKEGLDLGGPGVFSNISKIIKGALTKITAFKSQFYTKAGELMIRLGEGVANKANVLYQAGKNIMQGFLNGISSMFGYIKAKVSNFVSEMVKKVKDVLKIKSPSGVFKDIGQNVGQGLAIGIAGTSKLVDRAISQITPTSLDLKANNTGGLGVTNQFNVNATIREEADIDKVARRLKKLQTSRMRPLGVN